VGRERERERERESCCCNEEELAAIVYEEDQLLDQLLVMLLNAELVCVDDDLARLLLLVAELCGVPGRFRSGFAASRQRHSPTCISLSLSRDGFTHSQRINTEFSNSLGKQERLVLQIWNEKGIQSARCNSPG
jgi:hypothetical protein